MIQTGQSTRVIQGMQSVWTAKTSILLLLRHDVKLFMRNPHFEHCSSEGLDVQVKFRVLVKEWVILIFF